MPRMPRCAADALLRMPGSEVSQELQRPDPIIGAFSAQLATWMS